MADFNTALSDNSFCKSDGYNVKNEKINNFCLHPVQISRGVFLDIYKMI